MIIPFNIPFTTGNELEYIKQAIGNRHLSGNGPFTRKCCELLGVKYGFGKCLLTTSCTDALEMCALLLDIKPGDEVIVPAFTFVSTALAFARQGAKIVFIDSKSDNPCMDEDKIEKLITSRTKAIIPVHYGGFPCEMDSIMQIAEKHNLIVIEDSAHAFGSRYKSKLLGTIGHLGCFSFHETKVIHCGEGGMLTINDRKLSERAEIIWDKGTNRSQFQRGEVQKYEWLDTGSSFLLSDLNAAFLFSQLKEGEKIINYKKEQWFLYSSLLKDLGNKGLIKLPLINNNTQYNYSGFYLEAKNLKEREDLRNHLIKRGIQAITHYLDLSGSPYILKNQKIQSISQNENSKRYENTILRLPFYFSLKNNQIKEVAGAIKEFYLQKELYV
jgi:dTDP-4-amino-4,6-dideoxygalactose transaminase